MAKKEVFDHPIGGPLMQGMRHIPVDRGSGAGSFDAACLALKAGELVVSTRGHHQPQLRTQGVQVRRGADGDRGRRADRPAHRGAPSGSGPRATPQDVAAQGADRRRGRGADPPTLPAEELTARCCSRMQHLLEQVQDAYGPYPPGEFWVPRRWRGADARRGGAVGGRGGRHQRRRDGRTAGRDGGIGVNTDGAGLPHPGSPPPSPPGRRAP